MKATEILKEIVNGVALNWWLGRDRHHRRAVLLVSMNPRGHHYHGQPDELLGD
jgi:hypothetical protein